MDWEEMVGKVTCYATTSISDYQIRVEYVPVVPERQVRIYTVAHNGHHKVPISKFMP
jgi:hypothetical protein